MIKNLKKPKAFVTLSGTFTVYSVRSSCILVEIPAKIYQGNLFVLTKLFI